MKDWIRLYPFNDYDSALEHLEKRSKRVRCDAPIGNSLRLVHNLVAFNTVSVVYHQTAIVTYEPDGTQVLDWGGWFTRTTFEHIARFARLDDFVLQPYNRTRNGHGDGVEAWRTRASWPKAPARVRKCRACKGTGRRGEPSEWHDGACWRCKGAAEVDYGSKPETEVWDGTFQLLIHPDRAYDLRWEIPLPKYECKCSLCQCGCGNWQQHWINHAHAAKQQQQPAWASAHALKGGKAHHLGGEVAEELAELLPGLKQLVSCPRCQGPSQEANTRSVRDQIVHLNDSHRATREEIADWLDALDVDLRFPMPNFTE